jgi:hypothetical protein
LTPNLKKVFFLQDIGDDNYETESLWCIQEGDHFIIDNIPIIAKRISLGDTITAEYDADEKVYYFDDFVAVSGNTTVRIFFEDVGLIDAVRHDLADFGCESEVLRQKKTLAVNIPKGVKYKPIKDFLDTGEQQQKWRYEESCLAHDY